MTITQMLGQSIILTGLGMGVVFSFLIIMIFFMTLLHKVIKMFKLDKETGAAQNAAKESPVRQEQVVAAIAAALHEKQL